MKLYLFYFMLMVIPFSVFADGVQPLGAGTEEAPYQVATLDNLLWVSTNDSSWDSYFIQTADIDASDTQNWNGGTGFSPLGIIQTDQDGNGVATIPFTGSYDGNGFEISSVYIDRASDYEWNSRVGFFGYTYLADIKNLSLVNVDVSGYWAVGCLIGENYYTEVENCTVSGDVAGSYFTGGMLGYSYFLSIDNCTNEAMVNGDTSTGGITGISQEGLISNCYNYGAIQGDTKVGGIVGTCSSSYLSECSSDADIEGGDDVVGGVIGQASECYLLQCSNYGEVSSYNQDCGGVIAVALYCELDKCSNSGLVSSQELVGGLIGAIQHTVINNCYNVGEVQGNTLVGGLIAIAAQGEVNFCYNAGVLVYNSQAGGLVADVQSALFSINNSFWDSEVSYPDTGSEGMGIFTHWLQNAQYLQTNGWDFVGESINGTDDFWSIDSSQNSGYPILSAEPPLPNIEDEQEQVRQLSQINGNYPNPFNPVTTIKFSQAESGDVDLTIYNLRGQRVRTLLNKTMSKGDHSVVWNGTDDRDQYVSSGVYLIKLNTNRNTDTTKCILMK